MIEFLLPFTGPAAEKSLDKGLNMILKVPPSMHINYIITWK